MALKAPTQSGGVIKNSKDLYGGTDYLGTDKIESAITDPIEEGISDFRTGMMGDNTMDIGNPGGGWMGTQGGEEQALGMESRGMQGEYANLLRAQMAGRGPSLAQKQLVAGRDAAVQAATAGAAGARGANVALAGRSAGQGAGRATMGAGRDAAMLRAQEQLNAQSQFGNLAGAMRAGDMQARGITSAERQAQLNAQVARMNNLTKIGEGEAERRQQTYGGIASTVGSFFGGSDPVMKENVQPVGYGTQVQTRQAQQAVNSPFDRGYTAQDLSSLREAAHQSGPQADPAYKDPTSQYMVTSDAAKASAMDSAQKAQGGGLLGGILGGGGGGGGFLGISDPKVKDNVGRMPDLVDASAQGQPVSFNYKPGAAQAQGVSTDKRVGMLATGGEGALDHNPIYAPTVQKGPDGLAYVNTPQAVLANIAVTSDQSKRIKNLEAALMKQGGPNAQASSPSRREEPATYQNGHGGLPGTEEENVYNLARRTKNEMSPPPAGKDQGYPLGDPDAHNAALAEADWKANNLAQAMADSKEQTLRQNGQARDKQVNDELKRRRAPGGMSPTMGASSPAPAPGMHGENSAPPRVGGPKSFYPGDKFPMNEALARMREKDQAANDRESFVRQYQPGRHDKFETAPMGRPVLTGEADAPDVSDVNNVSADLASELSATKDPAERKKIIRRAFNVLGGAAHPDGAPLEKAPSPQFLGKALKQRGAKVSDKEIKDALRQEYTL